MKRLASSTNKLAAKFASQALKIIGEEIPYQLSPQVPLWTVEDVQHWLIQVWSLTGQLVNNYTQYTCVVTHDLVNLYQVFECSQEKFTYHQWPVIVDLVTQGSIVNANEIYLIFIHFLIPVIIVWRKKKTTRILITCCDRFWLKRLREEYITLSMNYRIHSCYDPCSC